MFELIYKDRERTIAQLIPECECEDTMDVLHECEVAYNAMRAEGRRYAA